MVPREEKEVKEEGGAGVEQEKEQSRKPDEDEEVQRKKGLHLRLDTYKEGVQRSSLHYADSNVVGGRAAAQRFCHSATNRQNVPRHGGIGRPLKTLQFLSLG